MNGTRPGPTRQAADLRLEFDRAFAEARQLGTRATESLLAVRLGSEPYAIRLAEIAGLHADRKITPVAGPVPVLLGIANLRGAILPVYSLSALLGHAPAKTPRWLVVAAGVPAALAFEVLDGQVRLPPEAIVPQQADKAPRDFVRAFAAVDGAIRPIVHLPSVLEVLLRQLPGTERRGE